MCHPKGGHYVVYVDSSGSLFSFSEPDPNGLTGILIDKLPKVYQRLMIGPL
jgi:hypothetical protein